jgi:hypothetical protein
MGRRSVVAALLVLPLPLLLLLLLLLAPCTSLPRQRRQQADLSSAGGARWLALDACGYCCCLRLPPRWLYLTACPS